MSGLKRLFRLLLIACTLGYSSAWAFDRHVMASFDESHAVTAIGEVAGGHHDDGGQGCDHCCHINAHLQAIFPQMAFDAVFRCHAEKVELSAGSALFVTHPDTKPPRV